MPFWVEIMHYISIQLGPIFPNGSSPWASLTFIETIVFQQKLGHFIPHFLYYGLLIQLIVKKCR